MTPRRVFYPRQVHNNNTSLTISLAPPESAPRAQSPLNKEGSGGGGGNRGPKSFFMPEITGLFITP